MSKQNGINGQTQQNHTTGADRNQNLSAKKETAGTAEALGMPGHMAGVPPVTKNIGRKKSKLLIILSIALAAAILCIAGAIAYQKVYYGSRWYNGTTIDGIDVSKLTLEESKEQIKKKYSNYTLSVTGRDDGTLTITEADINYTFDISPEFDSLYEEQHKKFQLFPKKNKYSLEFNISYNPDKLSRLVRESDMVAGNGNYTVTAPKSATVTYINSKHQYACVEEIPGNKIKPKKLLAAIEGAIQQAQTTLDITDEEKYPGIYKAPKVTSDSEELHEMLTACNNAALRYITWNMGKGVQEQITPADISKWITYKKGKITYDYDAMAEWVEKFCLKYKTVGKNRQIKSHSGETVTIYGGDYGWQLDYEKTVEQAKKALTAPIDTALTEAYAKEQSAENKKAITLKRKVIYANTAFKKDYENFINDWDTENYIEISISEQMVYVYRKGKLVFSCRCITGRPVPGRTTPTGAFYIKEHRLQYTLTGADYSTPVTHWVRITWTGTGFHPATWQPWSSWSPGFYKYGGSHGCINLEPSDAVQIYNLTKYREIVFIH